MAPCSGELGNTDPDVVLFTQMAGERLQEDPADADALFVLAASRMMCGRAFEPAHLQKGLHHDQHDLQTS